MGQPSVSGSSGPGFGGGRAGSQVSLSLNSGAGMGSGRPGAQATLTLSSGAGMGSGRPGSQPTITSPSTWVGKGKGRAGANASIENPSKFGGRTQEATAAWTDGVSDAHVADPHGAYVFALEVGGIEIAQFLECSGLKTSTQVFEIEEGGQNHRVHKLPGQSKWENITLRYGVTNDVSWLTWRNQILSDEFNKSSRQNGSIVMKDNQMKVVRRYHFVGAWPVSWEGPSFSANSSDLAIESVELAHHGIYVAE